MYKNVQMMLFTICIGSALFFAYEWIVKWFSEQPTIADNIFRFLSSSIQDALGSCTPCLLGCYRSQIFAWHIWLDEIGLHASLVLLPIASVVSFICAYIILRCHLKKLRKELHAKKHLPSPPLGPAAEILYDRSISASDQAKQVNYEDVQVPSGKDAILASDKSYEAKDSSAQTSMMRLNDLPVVLFDRSKDLGKEIVRTDSETDLSTQIQTSDGEDTRTVKAATNTFKKLASELFSNKVLNEPSGKMFDAKLKCKLNLASLVAAKRVKSANAATTTQKKLKDDSGKYVIRVNKPANAQKISIVRSENTAISPRCTGAAMQKKLKDDFGNGIKSINKPQNFQKISAVGSANTAITSRYSAAANRNTLKNNFGNVTSIKTINKPANIQKSLSLDPNKVIKLEKRSEMAAKHALSATKNPNENKRVTLNLKPSVVEYRPNSSVVPLSAPRRSWPFTNAPPAKSILKTPAGDTKRMPRVDSLKYSRASVAARRQQRLSKNSLLKPVARGSTDTLTMEENPDGQLEF